jgi:hypothetical protein
MARALHSAEDMELGITFRDMLPSPFVEAAVRRWVDRLEQVHGRVHRCAVMIEQPHHHHRRGNTFHVRIDLSVPGREIVVAHDPPARRRNVNAYTALATAFRAVRRRLDDYAAVRRHRHGS